MAEATQEQAAMSLEDAIISRRSVRGFLPDLVPEETLRKVFELAQRSPSNCNTQPWYAFVASGEACGRLRKKMLERIMKGVPPKPDYTDYVHKFEGDYRTRQVECAAALYGEMGIERKDVAGRQRASLRNFEFFDAPHIVFLGMHKNFGPSVAIDVGGYMQTLMLAMAAYGIGSCAQLSMQSYPDIVRGEFGASEDIRILVGISFGYEDPSVAANRTRTTRVDIGQCVTFKS